MLPFQLFIIVISNELSPLFISVDCYLECSMKRFFKKWGISAEQNNTASKEMREYDQRLKLYRKIIRGLLALIKDASLDMDELDAEQFKQETDRLCEKLLDDKSIKKIEPVFETGRSMIFSFLIRPSV